jgi:CHAT domain-containing protein
MALSGPVVDRLTVSRISDVITQGRAWIAYLSACSTAQVKTLKLADGGLHPASAFQVAGFAHVVGSLWPVADDVCVQVAKLFYENLSKGDFAKNHPVQSSNLAVAAALRGAVLEVRSERTSDPLGWAAFIHLGP